MPGKDAGTAATDYRLDDQVGFLMRQANQRHIGIFSKRLPELTPMQFAALAKLAELGSVSQNELGRQTAMDAATMKGVIERLAKKNLAATRPDPDDQRRLIVELTARGRTVYRAAAVEGLAITAETLEPLTAAETRAFLTLLRKLL